MRKIVFDSESSFFRGCGCISLETGTVAIGGGEQFGSAGIVYANFHSEGGKTGCAFDEGVKLV